MKSLKQLVQVHFHDLNVLHNPKCRHLQLAEKVGYTFSLFVEILLLHSSMMCPIRMWDLQPAQYLFLQMHQVVLCLVFP